MAIDEEFVTVQGRGNISWPQTLYKPHWHSAINASIASAKLESSLAAIDWAKVKEEIADSNKPAPNSRDYLSWLASKEQSISVVTNSLMFLENAINDLFAGGRFLRALDQMKLANNFLTIKDPRKKKFFSEVIGISEQDRLWLLAQPQADLLKLLGEAISSSLNDPGISDVGSAIDHINVNDRGTSPVQKIKRLKAILKGFANFSYSHEGDIDNLIRLRNFLVHGKAVLDMDIFSHPSLPSGTLASILSARPSHEQDHEDAVAKLVVWIDRIIPVKRPIPTFPIGWVGKDISEFSIKRVAEYCARLDKLVGDSLAPHNPTGVSFSHLFAPALTPWP